MSIGLGVVYLLTGAQHAARLVVSIYSLRRYYQGAVTVFTTRSESRDIVQAIAEDELLDVAILELAEAEGGSNSSYLTKPRLMDASPYDATLLLDADTLIAGDISTLLDAVISHPLVVTGFCDWITTGTLVQKRLEMWRPLANSPGDVFRLEELIDACSVPQPAINTGVIGFQRAPPIADAWRELTELGKDTFLPDEVALQLLLSRYPHHILGSQYNCSPAFGPFIADVRIWHFVAMSHLGHFESRQLWKPVYDECYEANVARLRSWSRLDDVAGDSDREQLARWPRMS